MWNQPLAYWNGRFVGQDRVAVPIDDQGFLLGVTIAERLRTFGGRLFRVREHLDRLRGSLVTVGLERLVDVDHLAIVARRLVEHNFPRIDAGLDLGLGLFVTPGAGGGAEPTVCLHSYPLPFAEWAELYEVGQPLWIVETRQVPTNCWPSDLKCRSRVHYYLADREARRNDAKARAILLDQAGHLAEASTANLLLVRANGTIASPRLDNILSGVSLGMLETLARQSGIPFEYQDLSPGDLAQAAEVMLCSTSPCLLPVCRVQGQAVGSGRPGPIFRQLMAAWSEAVGLDIVRQARTAAGLAPASK